MVRFVTLGWMLMIALAPLAGAAATRDYSFTDDGTQGPAGTFALADAPSGDAVTGFSTGVVFADPVALDVGVHVANEPFQATLYFERINEMFFDPNTPAQTLTIAYGYVPSGGAGSDFVSLAGTTATLVPEKRALVPELADAPQTGTSLDVGKAVVSFSVVDKTLPAGAHVAIRMQTSGFNSLYTAPSVLESSSASTATVPLPELPAVALFGVGAAGVLGLVAWRRRAGAQ